VGAEFITLVPTVTLAVLAVWWFRSSSILGGNKDKDEAEEAEKKEVGDSKDAATGGANTQGVQTAGPAGGPTGKLRPQWLKRLGRYRHCIARRAECGWWRWQKLVGGGISSATKTKWACF
jgi:hypothetical protein